AFDDADIIDVLLMFAYRLTQEDKKLKKIFEDELNKIEKKHNKSLEIESQKVINKSAEVGNDSKVSAGFSFFNFFKAQTDFFVSFKMDKQVRKHTREFFTFKKIDLLKTVNIIIEKLYDLKGINKELLVFFDDFDKLRNYEQIHSIFVDNRSFIEQINCRKIISIPINLTTDQDFSNSSTNLKVFAVKLLINPLIKGSTTKQNTIISNNKKLLFEIIKKRDPKKLINDDAIEKAIEYSGGILRQFVQLLKDATVNVRRFGSDKISVNDVNKAIEDKSLQLSLTVIGVDIIKLYKYIMEKNKPDTPKNTEFVTALLNLRVILHANGLYWYDLNPLIKKTVETYSKEKLDLENP
ncbi:MAG: hypothetical protein U9Q83_07005, partial [Bacteroidota bacterium]|nr:hypothetical protein [Bacteroidota bacterium]